LAVLFQSSPFKFSIVQQTLQKLAQLDDEAQMLLHDCCCLWVYVRAALKKSFNSEIISRHDEMFEKGYLGWGFVSG